jgi:hypothetical protein
MEGAKRDIKVSDEIFELKKCWEAKERFIEDLGRSKGISLMRLFIGRVNNSNRYR